MGELKNGRINKETKGRFERQQDDENSTKRNRINQNRIEQNKAEQNSIYKP